ncbi:hypothetical protein J6590_093368 [Homalodisca vitripennis]|nr:hypothetical protein J6590_093368 [Homalodisca vitripennis]
MTDVTGGASARQRPGWQAIGKISEKEMKRWMYQKKKMYQWQSKQEGGDSAAGKNGKYGGNTLAKRLYEQTLYGDCLSNLSPLFLPENAQAVVPDEFCHTRRARYFLVRRLSSTRINRSSLCHSDAVQIPDIPSPGAPSRSIDSAKSSPHSHLPNYHYYLFSTMGDDKNHSEAWTNTYWALAAVGCYVILAIAYSCYRYRQYTKKAAARQIEIQARNFDLIFGPRTFTIGSLTIEIQEIETVKVPSGPHMEAVVHV